MNAIIAMCWPEFVAYRGLRRWGAEPGVELARRQRFWLLRIAATAVVDLAVIIVAGCLADFWSQPLVFVAWVNWLGVTLCVLGLAFGIRARVRLGRDWSPMPGIKENHRLATTGPYQWVYIPCTTASCWRRWVRRWRANCSGR